MNLGIPIYCSISKIWNTSNKNALARGKAGYCRSILERFWSRASVCLTVAEFQGAFAKFASFSFYLHSYFITWKAGWIEIEPLTV